MDGFQTDLRNLGWMDPQVSLFLFDWRGVNAYCCNCVVPLFISSHA